MARNAQLVRALKLILILRAGRCDLASLAEALSVSSRTVRRDLAALEEAYFPLEIDQLGDAAPTWRMVGL